MVDQLRIAIRGLRHRRGVAAAVVVTLTLGIGANSAIFSAVDAVLLKPLPYPDADRLVRIYELNRGLKQATQLVAPVRLEEWQEANRSFDGLAGSYFENMTDTTGELPARVEAMRTSPRFFTVLGVDAAIGRTLTPAEEIYGGPPAVVISDALWRARFGGNPTAVGRAFVLNGVSRTIVGVMPPSFRYPTATTEAWVPMQAAGPITTARQARFMTAVGRMKPGVTLAQAADDLTTVQTRLGERFPDTDKGWGASIVALKEEEVGGVRRSLWLLFGAVALVLLAACGNVACVMLADATRRERDVAVRFALGASRADVVRELVGEGFVLAMIGSVLGLLCARIGIDALRRTAVTLPHADAIGVDVRLVLFTMIVGALTTIVFAVAPALAATRGAPAETLARGGRAQTGRRQPAQRALVTLQVALAIVLLTAAGLLVRSFVRLQQTAPGFDPAQVITFRMSASWAESTSSVVARHARTLQRLTSISGVTAAAASQTLPAGIDIPPGEFHIVGRDPTERTFAQGRSVTGGYFRTLRIPILQGSTCSDDPAAAPFSKMLVTRAFADRYFPGTDPIGHRITTPNLPPGTETEIIGVVGDVRENGLTKPAGPLMYFCGYSPYWPDPFFIVRTDPAHGASVATIRAALREIEPNRAMYAVRLLDDTLAESVAQQRLTTALLAVFGATSLLLAALGLYGVLSQLVAMRRREIGVRMALGAQARQILASVVAEAGTMTVVGIVAGLALALALARFMATLVFDISTHDPLTFAAVPVVLAVVATIAALLPARRAASVDPMTALRED